MRFAASVLTMLCVTLIAQAGLPQAPDTTGYEEALLRSRQAADDLLGAVRTVLLREMGAGGPVRAIVACADSAPALIRRMQEDRGVGIRRISNRWRNAHDIPDPYELDILMLWDSLHAAGTLHDREEHAAVVQEPSGPVFRYMRPIFVQGMCVVCHGERTEMKNLIATVLQDRYPADRATGYRPGDLRGAVSVRVLLQRP